MNAQLGAGGADQGNDKPGSADWLAEWRDSRRWILLGLMAGGVVTAAGALVGNPYWSSVVANLGTAVVLAIPLVAVERILARRVREARAEAKREYGTLRHDVDQVQQSVAAVSQELADLAQRTNSRVRERREQDEADLLAPARAIDEQPSYGTIMNALETAEREALFRQWTNRGVRATDIFMSFLDHGFTAAVSKMHASLHFPPDSLRVLIYLPGSSVHTAGSLWPPDRSTEDFFVELDSALRLKFGNLAPAVSPEVLLPRLRWTLEFALRKRAEGGAASRWALFGVVTDQWIVSGAGLEHTDVGVVVPMATLSAPDAQPPKVPQGLSRQEDFPYAWDKARRFVAGKGRPGHRTTLTTIGPSQASTPRHSGIRQNVEGPVRGRQPIREDRMG